MNRPLVVIDKSYLFGASQKQLAELFESRQVVMTEALFYELLTADLDHGMRCFDRIPSIDNPVLLIPNVGPILSWEVERQAPLIDLNAIAVDYSFQFNPGLTRSDFDMGQEQYQSLCEWQQELKQWVKDYADHASSAVDAFPELSQYRPGQDREVLEGLKRQVVSNRDFLKNHYHGNEGWPNFKDVDSKWALYLWLQIRLMAALDYFAKHGTATFAEPGKKLENDYLDLEYCLVGCLCGSLATRDKVMAERFQLLRPEGVLVS